MTDHRPRPQSHVSIQNTVIDILANQLATDVAEIKCTVNSVAEKQSAVIADVAAMKVEIVAVKDDVKEVKCDIKSRADVWRWATGLFVSIALAVGGALAAVCRFLFNVSIDLKH